MEYEVKFSKKARRHYQKLLSSGRKQLIEKTKKTIINLQNKVFTSSMKNHSLNGDKKGLWDVHVEGNFLITYNYNEDKHLLEIEAIGNHNVTDTESFHNDDLDDEETEELLDWI